METRIYHGKLIAADLSKALVSRFNRDNLVAQQSRSGDQYLVQIGSRQGARSGGSTALGIVIQPHEDGVVVKLGKQAWLGIAASLGASLIAIKRNPINALNRLDDIAQDIENIGLDDQVWDAIAEVAAAAGATRQISDRLRRTGCAYCGSANPVSSSRCEACGAPLGGVQPVACEHCGFVLQGDESICPNCKRKVAA